MIRVWNVNQRKVIDWQQTSNYITAMQINPQGDKLVVGLVDGVCLIYDYSIQYHGAPGSGLHPMQQYFSNPPTPGAETPAFLFQGAQLDAGLGSSVHCQTEKLKLERSIDVKNNNGKFSGGRKVTGIDFFNSNVAMVTTNDSRVRFINIVTGRCVMKIKGNKNESFHLRASLSPDLNHVICGSEDGDVFLWSQIESNITSLSHQQSSLQIISAKVLKATNKKNKDRSTNNQFEYWTAFDRATPVSAAIFAPKSALKLYSKLSKKVSSEHQPVNMIMVCCSTSGLIKVYRNQESQ